MKICVLADDFPPRALGGAGRVAEQVAFGYAARGHNVHVITTVRVRDQVGEVTHNGVTVHAVYSNYPGRWVAYRSLYNPPTVSKVRELFTSIQPDVVHAHNVHHHLSYHTLKLAKKSGAKVLLTAHDCMLFHYGKFTEYIDPASLAIPKRFNYRVSAWRQLATYKKGYNPLRNRIIRRYLTYVDAICAVSRALQEALAANGIPHVTRVYNGIDVEQWDAWAAASARVPALAGLEGQPVIGFVGKTSGAKGALELFKALREARKRLPEALILVIGKEEGYTSSARVLAKELGLEAAVRHTGEVAGPALTAAYQACTVVAFPSVCLDTFGMVNVEAMLSEKPVVATCFGGSPEIVVDGVTGTIVNPYDTAALSGALLDFLTHPDRANAFGSAGRDRVIKEFTLDRQVDAYLALMNN